MVGVGDAVASLSLDAATGPASRRRSAALASVIAATGGVACALSALAPGLRGLPVPPLDQAIHVAVAAAYIGAGVVALVRRPRSAAARCAILVRRSPPPSGITGTGRLTNHSGLSMVAVAAVQADEPGQEHPLTLDQTLRRSLENNHLFLAARPDGLH